MLPRNWQNNAFKRRVNVLKRPSLRHRPLPQQQMELQSQNSVLLMRIQRRISAASPAPCHQAGRRNGPLRSNRSFRRHGPPLAASPGFQRGRLLPASSRNTGPSRRAAIRHRRRC